jgi:hypothetical protein
MYERIGGMRNVYNFFFQKTWTQKTFGRHKPRWKVIINTRVKEIGQKHVLDSCDSVYVPVRGSCENRSELFCFISFG